MKKYNHHIICLLIFMLSFILTQSSAVAGVLSFGMPGVRLSREVKSLKEIRTQNIVTQSWDFSCGPATIATILTYYFNEPVSEREILNYLLLTTDLKKVKQKKGFSLLDLKGFAQAKGYKATGYKMDFDFLCKLDKPVLVPLKIKDYKHFVVFRGFRRDRVFIADPVLGHMTMRPEKFIALWNGNIGFIISKENKENPDSPLIISKDEEVLLSDNSYIQRTLGANALGKIASESEF